MPRPSAPGRGQSDLGLLTGQAGQSPATSHISSQLRTDPNDVSPVSAPPSPTRGPTPSSGSSIGRSAPTQPSVDVSEKDTQPAPQWAVRVRRWPWWPREASTMLASLVCFMAIVIVVAVYDGKPRPQWPYSITLNTFISILATLEMFFLAIPLQSCLGQLKWMRYDKPNSLYDFYAIDESSKSPWAAFLLVVQGRGGWLAKIAALITVISLAIGPFHQQLIQLQYAQVATGNATLPIMLNYTSQTAQLDRLDQNIDLPVRLGIYEGIFTSGYSSYNVTPSDQSNSTWSTPYRTLAICSSCEDLTPNITYNASGASVDGVSFTDSNTYLKTNFMVRSSTDGTLAEYTALGRIHLSQPGTAAARCRLQFCTQLFEATQANGILYERLLEQPRLDSNFSIGQSTPQGTFTVNTPTMIMMSAWLQGFFTVTIEHSPTTNDGDSSYSSQLTDAVGVGAENPEQGQTILQALTHMNDTNAFRINNLMDNVARSMTRALRQSALNGTSQVVGYTTQDVELVKVVWPWITLATIIHVAAVALLAAVIQQTITGGWQPWKGNAMATAFHGLHSSIKREYPEWEYNDEMEDIARPLRVKFTHTDEGTVLARD